MMTFPFEFKRSLIVFAAFSVFIVLYRKKKLFKFFNSKTIKKTCDNIEDDQIIINNELIKEQFVNKNLERQEEQLFEGVTMPTKVQHKFVKILTKPHMQNGAKQDDISLFMKKLENDVSFQNGNIQQLTEDNHELNVSNNGCPSRELTEIPDYVHINTPNDAYSLTNGEVCIKNVDISMKSANSNLMCNKLSPKSADEQEIETIVLNGESNKENASPTALPEIHIPQDGYKEIINEPMELIEKIYPNSETVDNVNCDDHLLNNVQDSSLVTKTDEKLAVRSSEAQVNESDFIPDIVVHRFNNIQIEDNRELERNEHFMPNVILESNNLSSISVQEEELCYDFYLDQEFIGRLIGRGGNFISRIKSDTKTHILIQEKNILSKNKYCVIRGTHKGISDAINLISKRFPNSRFPEVHFTTLDKYPNQPQCESKSLLHFVMGMNNPTIVSCVVNPGHMFFQLLSHPSFQSVADLHNAMNKHYSSESLTIGRPVEGTVCVGYVGSSWCRCLIANIVDAENCQIKLLDYGGYLIISNSLLRQIHIDHLDLPFQAVEGYLHNIKPAKNATEWSIEAFQMVTNFLQIARSVTVHIVNYNRDNTSLVNVYIQIDRKMYGFLNAMLVQQGLAEWINPPLVLSVQSEQPEQLEQPAQS